MSYFGNTLAIEVEENCEKLASTFRAGIYDADIFLPVARAALKSLVELAAYSGDIKSMADYTKVCRLLNIQPHIPNVVIRDNRAAPQGAASGVIQDNRGKRDSKGRFVHSDRSAQWLDDDNIEAIKKLKD